MKVLFIMRHPAAVRSLGSVLRLLDERGHRVHLAFRRIKTGESHLVLQRLADDCTGLTFGRLPGRGSPGWVRGRAGWDLLAERLRLDSDYLRYLEPRYADAPGLRARAERKAHPVVRQLARIARLSGTPGVRGLRWTLQAVEHCLAPPPHIERFLAAEQPDVVVSTHLAELGSSQADYVRAAKRAGIHTGYLVFSWDNLTNKGLVRDAPELVIVWNDIQAREAVELQAIPADRVRVTGASAYDHWFDWQPSRSREEFCREIGLRADRPILLYVCSSHFVAPDEVAFVRRWIASLRARGGPLAEAGVVVRPHPRNAKQWGRITLDEPRATVWPRFGEEPLDTSSRQNYFDSIYHSAAVVGINTSAQIESAIVGRPVHTVLAEEFRETQQGTLHFHYLKADEFGHLVVGRTLEEHLDQLERSVREGADVARNERFVRRFVRPLGRDVAGSPRVVDALEELAAREAPAADEGPALAPVVGLGLRPLAALAARRHARRRRAKVLTPLDELRRSVRKVGRDESGPPVVAGPWFEDEVGELLYWIPFLRWAQTVTFGFRERLVVVSRPTSAPWYAGIGARQLHVDDVVLDGSRETLRRLVGAHEIDLLPPSWLDGLRGELAARQPAERSLARLLEFAPPALPELPSGLELPDEFVAVRVSFDDVVFRETSASVALTGDLIARLAERHALVVLDPPPSLCAADVQLADGLDAGDELALVGRARGFVGSYGPQAYLAALLGLPSIALYTNGEAVASDDLQVAASFLGRPPFGRLHAVDAQSADVERLVWLAEGVDALAGV